MAEFSKLVKINLDYSNTNAWQTEVVRGLRVSIALVTSEWMVLLPITLRICCTSGLRRLQYYQILLELW